MRPKPETVMTFSPFISRKSFLKQKTAIEIKPWIKWALFVGVLLLVLGGIWWAATTQRVVRWMGVTQGTFYTVTICVPWYQSVEALSAQVTQRLDVISAQLSVDDAQSEISRFNRLRTTDLFKASSDFYQLMLAAKEIYQKSNGSFDLTIQPFVLLWGNGANKPVSTIPTTQDIQMASRKVGFHLIQIEKPYYIRKKNPEVELDLSAIAKGYTVDRLAELLQAHGIRHFLIEIGGEEYASGTYLGTPWRAVVQFPDARSKNSVVGSVNLNHQGFSTRSLYERFLIWKNQRYSHLLNPKTGKPVRNEVVSVMVKAPTAMITEALSTTLIILGPEKGLAILPLFPDTEALMVVADADGRYRFYQTNGFGLQRPSK